MKDWKNRNCQRHWLAGIAFLLAAISAGRGQFSCVTNNGAVTIAAYTGSGGAVTIPATTNGYPVVAIASYAFDNTPVTSVTIPNSVTNIGNVAFFFCHSLTNFSVVPGGVAYSSTNGVIFDAAQTTLVMFPTGLGGGYTIPGGVRVIASNAFYENSVLTQVNFPNSVTNIGSEAFYNCTALKGVAIPDAVASIGDEAFYNCYGMTSVVFSNSAATVGNSVFMDCSGLTTVVLGTNLVSLGRNAFANCYLLTSIVVPGSIGDLAGSAFYNCTSLASATLGNGIVNIDTGAFSSCPALSTAVIPPTVTNIAANAFYGCNGLTTVNIPNSVATMGDFAFETCKGLRNVTIGTGLVSLGNAVFSQCPGLTNITVASGNPAFSSSGGVMFDKNQTTIVQVPGALGGSYSIPGTVLTIGANAFANCPLTNVTIPNSVTSIQSGAFSGCASLTTVTVGNGVTNVGDDAFYYCTSIPFNIYFSGNSPSLGANVFYGLNLATATLYYYAGTGGWPVYTGGLFEVMLNAPNPYGFLQTTLSPAGAVTAGAQWQVDGGLSQPSGAKVSGLSVGTHTLSFAAVPGWLTPSNQTVIVSSNTTTMATGTYVQLVGSLEVTLNPSGAAGAGAQWQVDGGGAQPSGATVSNLSVGNHQLSFTTVTDWLTPPGQMVAITNGLTTSASGTYTALPQLFYLDNFQQFANGSNLTSTGYVPASGPPSALAITSVKSGSPTITVSNFLGNTWAYFYDPASSKNEYVGILSAAQTGQPLQVTWKMWIAATNTGGGVFVLSVPTSDPVNTYNPPIGFLDTGSIIALTNGTSPQIPIGSWGALAGTVMTNSLILNYANRTFSYTLNGQLLATLPLGPYFTNVVGAIYFDGVETSGSAQGNRFAIADVEVQTASQLPVMQIVNPGVVSNQFGFGVSWAATANVVVLAATNPGNAPWVPISTNALTNGSFHFTDPQSSNYSRRYYRVRWP